MSHVRGGAIGNYAIGEHRQVTIAGALKYEYDVRCSDCGEVLGCVRFAVPKIAHDPADCGLICGACHSARTAEESTEA